MTLADLAGNPRLSTFATTAFTVSAAADVDPPTLSLLAPTPGACVGPIDSAIVAYQDLGSGLDLGSFEARLNGVDVSASFAPVTTGATAQLGSFSAPEGPNTLEVRISDQAGNQALASAASATTPRPRP
ncbi:MAG: hypothetical protein R3F62_02405 [Planctomycetota bacterium]